MESEEQPFSESDSQNQSTEQLASGSQEADLRDQESPEESPLREGCENPPPESSPAAAADEAAAVSPSEQSSDPLENHEPTSLDGECTDLDNQLQEQSETEEDANPNVSWDKKDQPIDSILADWSEDIEAFEMMEKDEL